MDRRTRKDLKSDKFAEEVQHGFEFLTDHKELVIRYGSILLVVVVIVSAIMFYRRHEAAAREAALAAALRIDNATVGNAPQQTGAMHFATQAEKDQAANKAFSEIAAKYHGSQEGATAEFYLASDAADKGNLAEAEKRYKSIADSAPAQYSALAKLSLAKVYQGEGKDADAEAVLRDLIAHPTATVSKEQAQIQLAMLIGKKNPAEARKMLEPMQNDRVAISRAAVQALGELSAAQ